MLSNNKLPFSLNVNAYHHTTKRLKTLDAKLHRGKFN